jgi:hypothetical protein
MGETSSLLELTCCAAEQNNNAMDSSSHRNADQSVGSTAPKNTSQL